MRASSRILVCMGLLAASGLPLLAQDTTSPSRKVRTEDSQKVLVPDRNKTVAVKGNGAQRLEEWAKPGGRMIPVAPGQNVSRLPIPADANAFWVKYCRPEGCRRAVNAARADALRRLAEQIKGVHITSETSVRDLITEPDEVDAVINSALIAARETGIRYHVEELIVEVRMGIKLRTVYATLKSWAERGGERGTTDMRQLEKLTLRAKGTTISETGIGAPPERMLRPGTPPEVAAVTAIARNAPDWISRRLRVTGKGPAEPDVSKVASATVPARTSSRAGSLMARQAAELDARRRLIERINGLMITPKTSVGSFVALNDEIKAAMTTLQQGATVVTSLEKMMEDGTARVTVEIDLRPLWDTIIFHQRRLKITDVSRDVSDPNIVK